MKTLLQIKETIDRHSDFCRHQYYVKRLSVFSYIVDEIKTNRTTLYVLVEFQKPVNLFQQAALEDYLSAILEQRVDLVPSSNLKREIKDYNAMSLIIKEH